MGGNGEREKRREEKWKRKLFRGVIENGTRVWGGGGAFKIYKRERGLENCRKGNADTDMKKTQNIEQVGDFFMR